MPTLCLYAQLAICSVCFCPISSHSVCLCSISLSRSVHLCRVSSRQLGQGHSYRVQHLSHNTDSVSLFRNLLFVFAQVSFHLQECVCKGALQRVFMPTTASQRCNHLQFVLRSSSASAYARSRAQPPPSATAVTLSHHFVCRAATASPAEGFLQ
eukprot:2137950-Rhodomonas_salina.1